MEGHLGGARQPGAAAWPSQKERILFPLPRFACPPKLQGVSRAVQQRRLRIRNQVSNCNEVVDALNWMAGSRPGDLGDVPSPMQAQAMARVEGLVRDQKPSGVVAKPEEALRSLLRGGTPYDWKPSNETLASYQSDLVSLPDDVNGCPRLGDVLPPDDCRFNKKSYNDLVLRLHKIGYFKMITDARLSNLHFKVEFDGEVFADPECLAKLTAFVGLNDVKAVPAKTVGLENSFVDGKFARLLHDRGDPLVIHLGRSEEAMEELRLKFDGLGLELHGSEVHQGVEGLLRRGRCSGLSRGSSSCSCRIGQRSRSVDVSLKDRGSGGRLHMVMKVMRLWRRLWHATMHGSWEFEEDILVLEAWYLPELRRLQGNIEEDDAEGCSRICQGTHGLCSRSGERHVPLTGKDSSGKPLTSVAQAYPHRLCHRLVRTALAKYMLVPMNDFARPPRP